MKKIYCVMLMVLWLLVGCTDLGYTEDDFNNLSKEIKAMEETLATLESTQSDLQSSHEQLLSHEATLIEKNRLLKEGNVIYQEDYDAIKEAYDNASEVISDLWETHSDYFDLGKGTVIKDIHHYGSGSKDYSLIMIEMGQGSKVLYFVKERMEDLISLDYPLVDHVEISPDGSYFWIEESAKGYWNRGALYDYTLTKLDTFTYYGEAIWISKDKIAFAKVNEAIDIQTETEVIYTTDYVSYDAVEREIDVKAIGDNKVYYILEDVEDNGDQIVKQYSAVNSKGNKITEDETIVFGGDCND